MRSEKGELSRLIVRGIIAAPPSPKANGFVADYAFHSASAVPEIDGVIGNVLDETQHI